MDDANHDGISNTCDQREVEFADLGMCKCGGFCWVRYPLQEGYQQWHCTYCHTLHPLLREAG